MLYKVVHSCTESNSGVWRCIEFSELHKVVQSCLKFYKNIQKRTDMYRDM